MLKKHPTLKPVNDAVTAASNEEWTFTYINMSGQPAVLLSLDAMEYVLEALAGTVQNKKDSLKAYVQVCKSSFPSRKRGPAQAATVMWKML